MSAMSGNYNDAMGRVQCGLIVWQDMVNVRNFWINNKYIIHKKYSIAKLIFILNRSPIKI